jgi:guanylate kinase
MRVLCIIGPSASGKSTIVNRLASSGIVTITASVTDRPMRPGELAIEHEFVTSERFTELASNGELLGVVQPFGLPYRYGLPVIKETKNTVPLVMLRAPFVAEFKQHYPDSIVYQIEAPYEFVKAQLQKRGEPDIGTRLSDYEHEVMSGHTLAQRVLVNNGQPLDELTNELINDITEDFNSI